MPAVRPDWSDLPEALRVRTAELLDAPVAELVAASQDGGFTPGAALRVRHPATGRALFVKAIRSDHPLAAAYVAEARTIAALPAAASRPERIWSGEVRGWQVLALQDVEGRHPDLSPGSPDVPRVIAGIESMSEALDPAPFEAPPASVPHGWRQLSAGELTGPHAWAEPYLAEFQGLEEWWSRQATGTALVHNDIRPDNLLLSEGRVTVVDWAQARTGRRWRDTASLVPHLIMAGHTPDSAEAVVAGPCWNTADPLMVTANAVSLAGYLIRSAPLPPPPDVPRLRPYQARAARAVSAWVRHRAGLA